ncbi:MAG: carboxypeptidase regulatory-like domain-containing protein [Deltaproteobacteria bacterium]|nr:carboxypeptidase regulatory-like domain-containing protein [Deltaproteobacteria bacterium]
MKAAALALALALGACSSGLGGAGDDDGSPDAPSSCGIAINFDPTPQVEAGPDAVVRAIAVIVNPTGVPTFTWTVTRGGAPQEVTAAQADFSQVTFVASEVGTYRVTLEVSQPGPTCFPHTVEYNAVSATGNRQDYRVRVVPPLGGVAAPPIERAIQITGGGNASLGKVALDPGVLVTGTVRSSAGANVGAYLRFMPSAGRDAYVETFSTAANASYSARVVNQTHDVLVVPSTPGLAPRVVQNWFPQAPAITLDAGTAVSGTVVDAANAPIAGAKVRLTSVLALGQTVVEVPSTLATTSATGAFTVRAALEPNATVRFDVTPPAGSGLARLVGASGLFDLGAQVQVKYAGVATRSLAGTTVRRGGAPVAGAKVIAVGAFPALGTIAAGPTAVAASGELRIEAVANGAGVLPDVAVPALDLDAVVQVAPGDVAVADLNLTAQVPSAIDAPAMVQVATVLQAFDGAPMKGAIVDAIPAGALALAGAPELQATAGADGTAALRVAAGGTYDLHLRDPFNRGAASVVPGVTPATIAASYPLSKSVTISGSVELSTGQVVGGASVQLLCAACTGVERSRPVGEAATRLDGKFDIAVPDPGTMTKPVRKAP